VNIIVNAGNIVKLKVISVKMMGIEGYAFAVGTYMLISCPSPP